VGTDNPTLLEDPLYIGYPHRRLRGKKYDEFIEAFIQGVREVFPRAMVQWEDFHKDRAFTLLERYRKRVPCFNDDIQGTASVALAGILAALKITRQSMAKQRVVFIGAGEACTGIARLIATAMRAEGADADTIKRSVATFDSKGLLHAGREITEPFKREFAMSKEVLKFYGLEGRSNLTPVDVIHAMKPTILLGATAKPGAFTQEMIEAVAAHAERPIIMPLSNPTSKAECAPKEALTWTNGRAIVATGSPFPDVDMHGRRFVVGQANNVFIFPGVGLGAVVACASEVPDEIFFIAAKTLADCVTPERLETGAIYPKQDELREVSFKIACAVVRYARDHNIGRNIPDERVEDLVRKAVWHPAYVPVVRTA
jgi:malic enzyme